MTAIGHPLKIAISSPYSGLTAAGRQANLDRLNAAAAAVFRLGHIPLIGVNAALAVVHAAGFDDPSDAPNSREKNEAIMLISMAVVDGADAILHLADSPGANRERDHVAASGRPVYTHLDQVPKRNPCGSST
jgi:hypothetical protein